MSSVVTLILLIAMEYVKTSINNVMENVSLMIFGVVILIAIADLNSFLAVLNVQILKINGHVLGSVSPETNPATIQQDMNPYFYQTTVLMKVTGDVKANAN